VSGALTCSAQFGISIGGFPIRINIHWISRYRGGGAIAASRGGGGEEATQKR